MRSIVKNIRLEFVYPPIPLRTFDWCATETDYEPGDPIGFGQTAELAVRDLFFEKAMRTSEELSTGDDTSSAVPDNTGDTCRTDARSS